MKKIAIKPISRDKWDIITNLSVNDEQSHFIETSLHCLNDAKSDAYNMKWNFYGIYEDNNLIGFAMHGKTGFMFFSQVWLDRFMIDKNYQGKGYGKESMKLIIKKMQEDYSCKKLYLSVHENNYAAIRLYEKLGFKKTILKEPTGERIMKRINQANNKTK